MPDADRDGTEAGRGGGVSDPEDAGWWPAQPGERDSDGELVESLPETAELREWWPGDRREDAS